MRAAVYTRKGPAKEVLSVIEVPTPIPGAGEVRVKLAWSGVNPSDVKSRGGTIPVAFPRVIPHSDGAGVIDAVGEGVPTSRMGERVWIWNGQWGRADGTAAEYIVLPSPQAVTLLDNVALEAGACLGIPALTAYHAVTMDGGVADKSVLIAGGAGAVGHYAVQIAKTQGARLVIATVSSPEKAALAAAAGADVVINYKAEDLKERAREAAGDSGIDRIIEVDFAANVAVDLDLVAPEGDVVVYGSGSPHIPITFFPLIVKNVRLRFFIVYHLTPPDRAAAIAGLNEMMASGRLIHNIAVRLPLAAIAEAHEIVERGAAAGNTVVEL
jgi:NADPH:quinone reductase